MDWFRLYSEARNDAKLRTLTDAEHRVWFNLLCYAAEQKAHRGSIRDFNLDVLAVEVANGESDLLIETLKKLQRVGIVSATQGSHITFADFNPSIEPEYRREWRSLSRVLSPIVHVRDGYKCTYCHSTDHLSVDHIIPLSRGGSNELENLTTACRSCNSSKGDKSLEEWSR